jgi:hypothetical protein
MRRVVSPVAVWVWALFALASVLAVPVSAQSRASLDRDRISIDETATLTLEIDPKTARGLPDLTVLSRDFQVVDQNVQQQVSMVNGDVSLQITMQLTLAPLREGEIEIPMLRIGKDVTRPLRLTVLPSSNPANNASNNASGNPQTGLPPAPGIAGQGALFIESQVDSQTPYVQQTVGYTLRLYYESGTIIDGRLDQDPPEGASLQKIGDDLQSTQRVGNRDYRVVERRFLLIPERSGVVTIPPARFLGSGVGLFDSLFNSNRQELRVRGRPIELQVKPIPANARQPWLPLRNLQLRYLETPQTLRVGESATVMVEAVAEGATAAQLPALMLQAGPDAQMFPDQAQQDDRFAVGRPQATTVRRFSILPGRDGTLRITGPRIEWWDTEAGVARVASLPELKLTVAPGAAGAAATKNAAAEAPAAGGSGDEGDDHAWPSWVPRGHWLLASLGLLLLWTGVLIWVWRLWRARHRSPTAGHESLPSATQRMTGAAASARSGAGASGPSASGATASLPMRTDPQAWADVLARGNPGEIERMLCAMASPVAADLDAVRARLDDPVQRAAIDALDRARWGDGDLSAALAALRTAFAAGPRWRISSGHAAPELLPPLYPEA